MAKSLHRMNLTRGAARGPRRLSSSAASSPVDFSLLIEGQPLAKVDEVFNRALLQREALFPDGAVRGAALASMRVHYGRKLLQECGTPATTLARLADPAYLPSRDEIVEALKCAAVDGCGVNAACRHAWNATPVSKMARRGVAPQLGGAGGGAVVGKGAAVVRHGRFAKRLANMFGTKLK